MVLGDFNRGARSTVDEELLEYVFAGHAKGASGVKWLCRPRKDDAWSPDGWIALKVDDTQRGTIPQVDTMEKNVLYYDLATSFPFIDGVWKDDEGVVRAFQATVSDKHPKSVGTLKGAREKLGMKDEDTLHIYYVTIEKHRNKLERAPAGFFWEKVTDDAKEIAEAEKGVEFYLVSAPIDFRAQE